jgi:hypothetical protein
MLHGVGLVLCLIWTACQEAPSMHSQQPGKVDCRELDSLFATLGKLDSVLMNGGTWAECVPYLDASLPALTHNQRKENKDCNYLDQNYRPEVLRLDFVANLRNRIEEDTIPGGVYYLLRWMGIFKGDPEISEYFSEEVSQLAMGNPACYLGYLHQNPDQEGMLLYSTRWNAMDLDTLVARFSRLPDSDAVVGFLRNLKEQKTDGI